MCCPSHITSLLRKLELQILKGCSRVALLTSPLCCGHVVGIWKLKRVSDHLQRTGPTWYCHCFNPCSGPGWQPKTGVPCLHWKWNDRWRGCWLSWPRELMITFKLVWISLVNMRLNKFLFFWTLRPCGVSFCFCSILSLASQLSSNRFGASLESWFVFLSRLGLEIKLNLSHLLLTSFRPLLCSPWSDDLKRKKFFSQILRKTIVL